MLSPSILDELADPDAETDITATVVLDSNDVACLNSLDYENHATSWYHLELEIVPGPAMPGTLDILGVGLPDWRHHTLRSTLPFSDWHKQVCGPILEIDWTPFGGMLRYLSILKEATENTVIKKQTLKYMNIFARGGRINNTKPIKQIKLKQCRALIHLHFCQQAASAVLGEGSALSASYHTAGEQEPDAFEDGGMASSSASSSKGGDVLMDLLNDALPQALDTAQSLQVASGSYGGAPCHGHESDSDTSKL